jgi:FAD:protein FMN transferase
LAVQAMSGSESSARFPAFGSAGMIAVVDPAGLVPALEAVQRTVAAFDLACSHFRPDSEVSAVNRAGGSAVRVSVLLLEAVGAALRAVQLTDGDVDPTLGRALIALGYDREVALVPGGRGDGSAGAGEPAPPILLSAAPGWRTIRIDAAARTISVGRGISLDLGATAKALAADHAAAAARVAADCGVLVSLGGDIALAGPPPPDGWRVRVTDDHRAGVRAPGQWITLHSGGLATSSTTVRRWREGETTRHHLLDPASGQPAQAPWRTVSVAAVDCLDANIASTAAIVRGAGAADWLQVAGLPSRLVSQQGTVLHVAGWPAQEDDLAPYRSACTAAATLAKARA